LYSASHGFQPPPMRCNVTNDSRPTINKTNLVETAENQFSRMTLISQK